MDSKKVTIGQKTFVIKKMPATVAYEVALMYRSALESKNPKENLECLYCLCKYVEVDLKDGRYVALDNPELINQHVSEATDLIALQKAVIAENFGFFQQGADSRS